MNKFILVLVIILIGGLIIGKDKIDSGELGNLCKANPSLSRFAIINSLCTAANSNVTLKCSYDTHTCENLIPKPGSGNYKITITVDEKPAKGIEVDLGINKSATGDSYIKTTDNNGEAFFKGVPADTYYQSMNLDNFPKEYGDAFKSWTWATVKIVKDETTEMKMDLHSD